MTGVQTCALPISQLISVAPSNGFYDRKYFIHAFLITVCGVYMYVYCIFFVTECQFHGSLDVFPVESVSTTRIRKVSEKTQIKKQQSKNGQKT